MANGGADADLSAGGVEILIIRPALKTDFFRLEKGEYEFLTAIKNGNTLYESFEKAESVNENFDIGTALQKFIGMGVFTDAPPLYEGTSLRGGA